jgi:hypothetical protein
MLHKINVFLLLQKNVVFFTQKVIVHDTCDIYTLWFHPLQSAIYGVYLGIHYIEMEI